jgi:tetratricopeptide (TPR) repeat protein
LTRIDRPAETAIITALSLRYDEDPGAERRALDSAYASAMKRVAEEYPDDADVLALYAASLMNLNPWNYWSGDYGARTPNPGTGEILSSLERALELQPDNPGACHYYIHSVEAAYPERAVACADRLAKLMPGAGHIVHMPGHIYIRVGRYADAVEANEHAVHSDESYIADQSPMGIYPAAYYPHNYHFMAFAATMAGMSEKALEASRIVSPKIPRDIAMEVYWIQNAIVLPQLTQLTFGQWEGVLELELPSPDLWLASALAHYARGVAHAALGQQLAADEEAARLAAVARDADPKGQNDVLNIAMHALRGEMALRSGDPGKAVSEFSRAAAIEDAMLYEEPPLWYYPVRHSLGRALLEAGRPAEAEAAYREDLLRFPENGWSLIGLANALEAQGDEEGARGARVRFGTAWKFADVNLTQSRM